MNKSIKRSLVLLIIPLIVAGLVYFRPLPNLNQEHFNQSLETFSDIIVYDIFSPPQASRIYAYPLLAAHEIMAHKSGESQSLVAQLNGIQKLDIKVPSKHAELAALHSFFKVAKSLIFSEKILLNFQEKLYREALGPFYRFNRHYLKATKSADKVSKQIIAWIATDNYNETRTFPAYQTDLDNLGKWKPTPPLYMEGIEPHWNKIRPFILESAQQFTAKAPPPFSMQKGSPFYQEVKEVYNISKTLNDTQKNIADFWDCNPYKTHMKGHVVAASKKITPGAHWIGITNIVANQQKSSFTKQLEVLAIMSITIADAFIAVWHDKYKTAIIRPEHLIRDYFDPNWKPFLETPPFPEYTSGHSVVSGAAAEVATSLLGHNITFIDDTEVKYGLPKRTFKSFRKAAEEAAISRLYAGIHYRMAIEEGLKQGKKIGHYTLSKVLIKPN